MLLAIDIGNTNITIGIFPISSKGSEEHATKIAAVFSKKYNPESITAMWRISTDARRTADEYGTQILDFLHYSLINKEDLTAVAISSVVPPLDETISSAVKKYLNKKPLFLTYQHFIMAGLKIEVDNPDEVGVDRLVNAFAAHELYQKDEHPALVVDFGTAVTFDCVGTKGEYLGGVILPGIAAATDALARHTAKLPRISLTKPKHLIGKNTVECIQSGMWHGYIFIIKNFISAIRRELGKKTLTVATGGGMALFNKNDLKEIDIFSPTLTLEGIKILWEKTTRIPRIDKK